MSKLKPAVARLSKDRERAALRGGMVGVKRQPSRLALLYACMNFVGGVGRLLDVIAKVHLWWHGRS